MLIEELKAIVDRGEIIERVVTLDDLKKADGVYLINSVQRRIPAQLIDR